MNGDQRIFSKNFTKRLSRSEFRGLLMRTDAKRNANVIGSNLNKKSANRSDIEYLILIMLSCLTLSFDKKSNIISRLFYDLIRFIDKLAAANNFYGNTLY